MAESTAENGGKSQTNGGSNTAEEKYAMVASMGPDSWGERVCVSRHPVMAHKITILRSSTTQTGTFRAVLREVTYHLGYEATSQLTTRPVAITVPVPSKTAGVQHVTWDHGRKIRERVALIPIMRSGLGMVDAMLELLPNASIHHIGMYKRAGENPVQYFNRLPRKCSSDVAYVLDPLIASGGSAMSVISTLKKWGVEVIHLLSVVASKRGLEQLSSAHPEVFITVGAVDSQLTDDGSVLPGLGDVGDRQFGTNSVDDDDEDLSLLHHSKRSKRSTPELSNPPIG